MPWTGEQFGSRHNHDLTHPEAAHAARIANAVLRRSGDEGMSIAVANRYFQHRDSGGIVDPTSSSIGGVAPSPQAMNPLMQGMVQRYASLPVEKLQELAGMMGGSPQGQIVQRLLAQKRMMPQANQPQPAQAQATPPQMAQPQTAPPGQYRRGGSMPHRAPGGGMMSPSEGSPWWARQEQGAETTGVGATGFLHGSTPGRADQILTTAPAGSHVIPADVVAGLGEGNSLAGARVMDQIIRSGPGGIPMPRGGARPNLPRPPAAFHQSRGGETPRDQTPVALSHGEFIVPPEHVERWGNGDAKVGHKIFDHFIMEMRKKIVSQIKKLPAPVGMKK